MIRKAMFLGILGVAVVGLLGCPASLDLPAGDGAELPAKPAAKQRPPASPDMAMAGPAGGEMEGHCGGHMEEETVACCFADGTCADLFPHDCMAEGGMPRGWDTACETVDCEAGETTACCFEDDTCDDLFPPDCMTEGGMPQGWGTSCETTDCEACGGHGGGGHGGGGHGGGGHMGGEG